MTNDCIFCRIVAGEADASIAYKDEATLAFMDVGQLHPGHTLLVPKRHIPDIYGLDGETGRALMAALVRVATAVREAFKPEGLNVWQSNGAPWQEVIHLHFHVPPRHIGDGLLRFPPPRSRPSRAVLDKQAAAIRAALAT